MAGFDVSASMLNQKAGEAILSLRRAFDQIETVRIFLAAHPGYDASSPLVSEYGFTTDEAYLLQSLFESLDGLRLTGEPTLATARRLTGLE